ncbi:MAG: hypothetical protein MI923_28720 [Phycisphaerales bacterium]|nr:hypothetical protein [Phycisphaerales bacterium]
MHKSLSRDIVTRSSCYSNTFESSSNRAWRKVRWSDVQDDLAASAPAISSVGALFRTSARPFRLKRLPLIL